MTIYTLSLAFILYIITTLASPLSFFLQSQNLTAFTPQNAQLQAPSILTAEQWLLLITEGILNIYAHAPSARLHQVDSSMDHWARGFSDAKSLRYFAISCYDPNAHPSSNALLIKGKLDRATGKAVWEPLKTSRWDGPVAAESLWWFPDHDVFQADAKVSITVTYNHISYKRTEDKNVYEFRDGLFSRPGEIIDAKTLESLHPFPGWAGL